MKQMYTLRITDNGGLRRSHGRFSTRKDARRELNKILAPSKVNKYGVKLTSYRDAQSGGGINNPRIKRFLGFA